MTLLRPWALAGLVLLVPLAIAHLRRRPRSDYVVPSLLLWDGLEQQATTRSRALRWPALPLILVLQALALVLLVVALASPAATGSQVAATHVYVLDDSLWMGASGRRPAAEARLRQLAAALPRSARVQVVLADGTPHVIYRGSAAGLRSGLRQIPPGVAQSSLAQAMSLAAGLLSSPRDRVVLLRAPEDRVPALQSGAGRLGTIVIGGPLTDQGIFSPSARCGGSGAGGCKVLATVSNSSGATVTDRYTAYANGRAIDFGSVRLGSRSSTEIEISAPASAQIRVRLGVHDALPVDDQAWASVPGPSGAPPSAIVTLVGTPSDALPVARALAAVPGVTVRFRTPADYRPADADGSALTVADGWLPAGGLPPSPAVVLINPPRLPGGKVGAPLADSTPSGEDPTNVLASGLDLTSLSIGTGAARAAVLPDYMMPVVWSPDGALLAAGDDGRRRVAVLSFDPAQSNLPQLPSFPILALNLVRWAAGWTPASATAGESLPIDATPGATELRLAVNGTVVAQTPLRGTVVDVPVAGPGLYAVTETGPGVERRATVAVSVAGPANAGPAGGAAGPVDLAPTRLRPAATHGPMLAPWLLAAAIVLILCEWAYWRSRTKRLQAAW